MNTNTYTHMCTYVHIYTVNQYIFCQTIMTNTLNDGLTFRCISHHYCNIYTTFAILFYRYVCSAMVALITGYSN